MVCETRLRPKQTLTQRKAEISEVIERMKKGLVNGSIKAVVGPQGAIAFQGLTETDKNGVSDACAYRRLLASGSALALQAIQRAEMLAGRKVDKMTVASGYHMHGDVWHGGHKH